MMGFNLKCGLSKESWTFVIGVIDIVRGTCGLVFFIYLCFTIIPWISESSDLKILKHQLQDSYFIHILVYGGSRWGILLTLIGGTLWNLLLIIFGILLIHGIRHMETTKLRSWYMYSLFSNIVFIGVYARLGLTQEKLSGLDHSLWIGVLVLFYICICFIPTLYSLVMVHCVVWELYEIQMAQLPTICRRKSSVPTIQNSKL